MGVLGSVYIWLITCIISHCPLIRHVSMPMACCAFPLTTAITSWGKALADVRRLFLTLSLIEVSCHVGACVPVKYALGFIGEMHAHHLNTLGIALAYY